MYKIYFKNITNKYLKLENNLFDVLYFANYKTDLLYNKDYFVINGYIAMKSKFRFKFHFKKNSKICLKSKQVSLFEFIESQDKRKKTLFLH